MIQLPSPPPPEGGAPPPSRPRISRRRMLGVLVAIAGSSAVPIRHGLGQDDTGPSTPPIQSNATGEMPTTGAARPGPVGQQPRTAQASSSVPSAIFVEKAEIDAEVETIGIVDGVMENPTGPWVVSWYKQTAELGETGNVVMAGHVDYWDVGPAVFFNLRNLTEDDQIRVTGEDGSEYVYAVEWIETFDVTDLTSEVIADIVGPTPERSLTLITCGGEFDYATGEYLSRMVVRARLVSGGSADESTPAS